MFLPFPVRPHRIFALPFCLLVASHAAAAQPAAASGPAVPAVTISARTGAGDSAVKTVISSATIRRHGDSSLLDVLKRVPGITVAGGLRMRGLGEGYIQVMLNGEAAPPGFSIESLSPDTVERIEILRSASAEHGARGIAGTINIVLRRAAGKAQRELRVDLAQQSARPAAQAAMTVAGRRGELAYVVAGGAASRRSALEADLIERSGSGTIRTRRDDLGRTGSLDLSPRLTWQAGGGQSLAWQSFFQWQRIGSEGRATSSGEPSALPLFDTMDTRASTTNALARSSVNWLKRLDSGASIDLALGVTAARRRQEAHFEGARPRQAGNAYQDSTRDSDDRGLTGKGKYRVPASADHEVVIGWEGARNTRDEARTNLRQDDHAAPTTSDGESQVRVRRLAAFAQDEWRLGRGWSAYLGLRWEQVGTVSGARGGETVDNRYAVWSPIAQALWRPPASPGTQLRLGLARTYEAPMPQVLIGRRIVAVDNKATTPDYEGNPGLRPTLSWGLDLGLEHDAGDGVTVSGNAYARRLDDIAARSLRLLDGRWVAMMDNHGSASVHGVDVDLRLARSFSDGAIGSLEARANAARNWSRVDQVAGPHNRLDSQVPVSASAAVDVQMRALPLALGGQLSFQAGGLVANSNEESTWTSASRVLDLYGTWTVSRHSRLKLTLANVLGQPSEVATTLYGDGAPQMQTLRSAGAPTIRLGWELRGW